MRNLSIRVYKNGITEIYGDNVLLGFGGEHNATNLKIEFEDISESVFSGADYYRLVFDGFYSDDLYLSENILNYNVPAEVMIPPSVHCQLVGYKVDGGDVLMVAKSDVFELTVGFSETPYAKVSSHPDIFDRTLEKCKNYYESAENSAQESARYAEISSNSVETTLLAADNVSSIETKCEDYLFRASDFAASAAVSAAEAEMSAELASNTESVMIEKAQGNAMVLNSSADLELVSLNINNPVMNPTISVYGKNLLNAKLWNDEATQNGITIQYIADEDALLLNGTALTDAEIFEKSIDIGGFIGKTCTMSTNIVSGSITIPSLDKRANLCLSKNNEIGISGDEWLVCDLKNGVDTKILDSANIADCSFFVSSGVTFNDVKLKIQLEMSSKATKIEPFKPVQSVTVPYQAEYMKVGYGRVEIKSEKIDVNYTEKSNETLFDVFSPIEAGAYSLVLNQEMLKNTTKLSASITGNTCSADTTYAIEIVNLVPFSTEVFGTVTYGRGGEGLVFDLTATEFDEITGFPKYIIIDFTNFNCNPETITSYNATVSKVDAVVDISDTEVGLALLDLHTNYPTTTLVSDVDCEVTYFVDIKNYIDKSIGDVADALDSIIDLQESIIGGGTV